MDPTDDKSFPEGDEHESSAMVTVANCFDFHEALRLQMALGSADINSFIPDESTAINAPIFFIGSGGGVRLQVAEEDLLEAQQIIKDARAPAREEETKDESTEENPNEQGEDDEEERL